MIGAFDTKGAEYAFLRDRILAAGHDVLAVDTGVFPGADAFPVDIGADQLASAGGKELGALRRGKDRGDAMRVMCRGAAAVVRRLFDQGKCDGIIGMGGTGGTAVVTAAMREARAFTCTFSLTKRAYRPPITMSTLRLLLSFWKFCPRR